ncbi:hypothetical protein ACTFIZ_003942 [Dictyostelium cf. discoideum]
MNNRQEEPTNENTDPNQNNSLSITSFKLPPYNTLLNNYNNKFKNHNNNNNNKNNKNNKNKNNNCINKMEIINDILTIDNSDEELNNNNNNNNNRNNNNINNQKRIRIGETISLLEGVTISQLTEDQRHTFQQRLGNVPNFQTQNVTPPTTPPGPGNARPNNPNKKVDHMESISKIRRKLEFSFNSSDIV